MLVALLGAIANMFSAGTGNYVAGIATRKVSIRVFLLWSNAIGIAILLPLSAGYIHNPDAGPDFLLGILAGTFSVLGITCLFSATQKASFGSVYPITGVLVSCVPPAYRISMGDVPNATISAGFIFGLIALILLSRKPDETAESHLDTVVLAALAGIFIGTTVTIFSLTSGNALPLGSLGLKLSTGLVVLGLVLVTRTPVHLPKHEIRDALAVAILFVISDLSFLLAVGGEREKYLTPATLISGMSLAVTVLLGKFFSHEPLARIQFVGLGFALGAVSLVTIGTAT